MNNCSSKPYLMSNMILFHHNFMQKKKHECIVQRKARSVKHHPGDTVKQTVNQERLITKICKHRLSREYYYSNYHEPLTLSTHKVYIMNITKQIWFTNYSWSTNNTAFLSSDSKKLQYTSRIFQKEVQII